MNQEREHLRLLALFHYVVAGLTALFALFPVFHLVIGIWMASGQFPDSRGGTHGHGEEQITRLFGWFFILFATAFILCGFALAACLALAGRFIAQRRNHTFCVVVAAVACVFFPFGTALGVFSLILLTKPSVKALFAGPASSGSLVVEART